MSIRSDTSLWHSTVVELDAEVPVCAGTYAIFGDEKLLYIGYARNLRRRIRGGHGIRLWHYSSFIKTPWGSFSKIEIRWLEEKVLGEAAMLEIQLIQKYQPKFNKIGTKRYSRKNG